MRRRPVLVALVVFATIAVLLALAAGISLRGDSAVRMVEERFGVHAVARLSDVQVTLPPKLDDPDWGLKQSVIFEGGYDFRPYAGREVTLQKYLLREHYGASPLYLWLVVKDNRVVGAYATVTEASGVVPGVFSVSEIAGEK
jgi:hypothetical protein